MYCQCRKQRANDGWTRRSDNVWVHPPCNMPHKYVVEKVVNGEIDVPITELNIFQYGEHHNELWTVRELLYGKPDAPSCAPWITDYVWCNETITGSESGRVARVWKHRDHVN